MPICYSIHIFNSYLNNIAYSSKCKKSIIIPLPKMYSLYDLKNIRPIS